MTSSPVQPVPDRCITRLWHTQSGTRRGGVADLRLRAIQISCTPFHPLRRLSLALSSLWMSVLFLFFSTVSPALLYTFFLRAPVIEPFSASVRLKKLFPLKVCLHPTILNFMFLFLCLLFPYFPSPASSVSGTEGAPVCDCVSALHVCLNAASQFGSIQNNIQQPSRFIRRSVVRGSTPLPAHFPSHSPLFTPFHTWPNACHGK